MAMLMHVCVRCGTQYGSGIDIDGVTNARIGNASRNCPRCGYRNVLSGDFSVIGGVVERLVKVKVPEKAVQQFVGLVQKQQQDVISLSQLERKAAALHPDLGKAVKKLKKHWKKVGLVTALMSSLASCYPGMDFSGHLDFNVSGGVSVGQAAVKREDASPKVDVQEAKGHESSGETRAASGSTKEEGQHVAHTRSPRPKPRGRIR